MGVPPSTVEGQSFSIVGEKPMNKLRRVLLLTVILGASHRAQAQTQTTYYVPVFYAITDPVFNEYGSAHQEGWKSTLHAYNNTNGIAHVSVDRAYGLTSAFGCQDRRMPPNVGMFLSEFGECFQIAPGEPAFAQVTASPGVILAAGVERFDLDGCGYLLRAQVAGGRAALPVYAGLFPGGATAVCGDIDLGNPRLSDACTADAIRRRYRRRVNLVLFNASPQATVFRVIAKALHNSQTALATFDYPVEPWGVEQFNDLLLGTPSDPNATATGGIRIWLTIQSPYDFLAYAASIFEDGDPGTNAFEIFPARTASPAAVNP